MPPLSPHCSGSTQPAADASSRCVTPTWADPARTSPSSAGLCGGGGEVLRRAPKLLSALLENPSAARRRVTPAERQAAQPDPTR